ncbi:MAG: GTP 3',8-cyclase MoaA [Proteobacteria bacterium]|nr:GTP 3',8-cyclase MoaA [Pseudomonadota bacterium]MBU4286861.1 GTP 3',8-cyclase MoaA [Pseudomonadota bacterium]MCG2758437.1 GTP 3',8-cyclase MoaA [Desulfobacteraceae bacterium]
MNIGTSLAPNIDHYNRRISYLRVSVTDRCNLRCIYCLPVKDLRLLDHAEILSYEEILEVVIAGTECGIRKVRLTGGEPLARRNFVQFVASVCRIPKLEDVSITTNGVLLKERAKEIFDAGVHRINISLDTLHRLKYAKITGYNCFDEVWEGLKEAEAVGFSPIKINVVAIRGLNDDEFPRLAELSVKKPYHVRFIEYMSIGHDSQWKPEKYISSDEIKSKLKCIGPLHRIPRATHDGPAERYRFESARGEIGFISVLSHRFCPTCNRLRLTADGKLRPCLFADNEVDVKTPIRNRCTRQDLKELFRKTIAKKPRQHHTKIPDSRDCLRPMYAIGG